MQNQRLSDAMKSIIIPKPILGLAGGEHAARQDDHSRQVEKDLIDGGFPKLHLRTLSSGSLDLYGEWNSKLVALETSLKKRGAIIALIGPRGTGKTQMAATAAYSSASERLRIGYSRSARYCRVMEFFMAVKDSYNSSTSERDAFDPFTRPQLLVLDEVQVRNESKWEDNALTFLIDSRYGACLSTILISNQTVDGFQSSMGDSIMSRISETGIIIMCNWKSFREAAR